MNSRVNDDFETMNKCKLYRDVYDIMHPSISKKNVSNYKIILRENLVPVEVFYPEKHFKLEKIIIYVHGSRVVADCGMMFDEVCRNMASRTERLVIALDYEDENFLDTLKNVKETICFLRDEMVKNGILEEDIALMGDDVGANIILGLNDGSLMKKVLLYPLVSGNYFEDFEDSDGEFDLLLLHNIREYFNSHLKTKKDFKNIKVFRGLDHNFKLENSLIVVGGADSLKTELLEFYQRSSSRKADFKVIDFMGHSFFNEIDFSLNEELFKKIDLFLNDKNEE